MLFEGRVRERFPGQAAREAFANAVLDESDAVVTRAHAIEALDRRFSKQAKLGASERATIDRIRDDHHAAFRQHVSALNQRLAFLDENVATALNVKPGGHVFASAIELDRLISAAFAGAASPLTDAELAARIHQLLRDFDR